jgi:hypothetical protein
MSVTVSQIWLVDAKTGEPVEAELRDVIEEAQLADWENLWCPSLDAAVRRLHSEGVPRSEWPQSRHWDWRAKLTAIRELLAHQTFSIVCQGETQGLMAVNLTKPARLPNQHGKPMVYVEFLETAPWNRAVLYKPPRYSGVGSVLIRTAVELSVQEGFKGRIGLHSLPQADGFYRIGCGMSDLGPDKAYHDLRYFEMTETQAEEAIRKGES